jgi:hypothetical protein
MGKKLFLMFALLWLVMANIALSAQESNGFCHDQSLINTLYYGNIDQIDSILSEQNWLLISHEKDMKFPLYETNISLSLAVWMSSIDFDNHYIYLYYGDNHFNYVECIVDQDCFYTQMEIAKEKFEDLFLEKRDGATQYAFCDNPGDYQILFIRNQENSREFKVAYFNKNQLEQLVLKNLKEEDEVEIH